jgi:tetratricopeptide (TPR) repeat protein
MMRRNQVRWLCALAPALLGAGAVALQAQSPEIDGGALCRRAQSLKLAGRLDEAGEVYREAVRLAPDSGEAWWGLAWVYRKQGRTASAIEAFRKAYALATESGRRREAQAALERMGAAPEPAETVSPEVEPTIAGAQALIRQGRQTAAVRLLRTLRESGAEATEAAQLLRELKQGRRLVRVRAAADPVFRSLPDWEARLRARMTAAAGELSRQVELDFALVDVEPWELSGVAEGGMEVVADLRTGVSSTDVDVVIGFLAERREPPAVGERLELRGQTLGLAPCFAGTVVVVEVAASRDGTEWRMPEATLRENLAHELGHLFGAVHVTGESVMRVEPGGSPTLELDALNLEVMRACRWIDFSAQFPSLEPADLSRLETAYAALAAGSAADDGARFYRALALSYLRRNEEAIQEYELVLKTSPKDAYTYLNLGRLYEETGALEKARTYWRIAAALGSPAEVADMARDDLARTGG